MLSEASQKFADAKQRFDSVAEALPLSCVLVDANSTQVLTANSLALQLFSDGIIGQALISRAYNPQQLSDSLKLFASSRSAMPGHWQLQSTAASEHKKTLNLRVTGALFDTDNSGAAKLLLITLNEQTNDAEATYAAANSKLAIVQHELQQENKIFENEVAKRTKKLELRNEELDELNQSLNDFVSIVSHDLAASTRRIESFSTLLQQELPAEITTGNIEKFLYFLVESARRLTQMIDGCVRLSRILPAIEQWSHIDIEQILELVGADVRHMHPSVDFTLNHQQLQQPYADAAFVEQLLKNLIDNAVKFRRADTPLVIEISSKLNSELDYVEFAVTDNGRGIDPHDLNRVMQPFTRGTDPHDATSNGLGLAMCVRICQQHQGRCWIERSNTGENGEPAGTEVRFRLPAGKITAVD